MRVMDSTHHSYHAKIIYQRFKTKHDIIKENGAYPLEKNPRLNQWNSLIIPSQMLLKICSSLASKVLKKSSFMSRKKSLFIAKMTPNG